MHVLAAPGAIAARTVSPEDAYCTPCMLHMIQWLWVAVRLILRKHCHTRAGLNVGVAGGSARSRCQEHGRAGLL